MTLKKYAKLNNFFAKASVYYIQGDLSCGLVKKRLELRKICVFESHFLHFLFQVQQHKSTVSEIPLNFLCFVLNPNLEVISPKIIL